MGSHTHRQGPCPTLKPGPAIMYAAMQASQEEPASACLLVLIGLPAAGKSTLAQALTTLQPNYEPNVVIHVVSYDRFLEDELHVSGQPSDFNPDLWQASRTKAMQHAEWVLQQSSNTSAQQGIMVDDGIPCSKPQDLQARGTSCGHSGQQSHQRRSRRCLVVIDDNMHITSMRYACWQMARRVGVAYVQVYLDCPLDTAISRNSMRSPTARVPDNVIHRMAAAMCPPPTSLPGHAGVLHSAGQREGEGPSSEHGLDLGTGCQSAQTWERATLRLRMDGTTSTADELAHRVWQWLSSAWQHPAPPVPDPLFALERRLQGQQANAASLVHMADLESRRQVAECIKHCGKERRAVVAQRLQAVRKQLLRDVWEAVKTAPHAVGDSCEHRTATQAVHDHVNAAMASGHGPRLLAVDTAMRGHGQPNPATFRVEQSSDGQLRRPATGCSTALQKATLPDPGGSCMASCDSDTAQAKPTDMYGTASAELSVGRHADDDGHGADWIRTNHDMKHVLVSQLLMDFAELTVALQEQVESVCTDA